MSQEQEQVVQLCAVDESNPQPPTPTPIQSEMEGSKKTGKGHKGEKHQKHGQGQGHPHEQIQQHKAIHSEFISRLFAIPVITAAWTFFGDCYTKAKSSVWIFRKASDWTESSFKFVLGLADPFINQISPFAAAPLEKIDNIASQGLAKLERTVPAITREPAQIVSDTKEIISATTRPAVERLNHVSETVLGSKPAQLSLDVMEKILSSGNAMVNNVLPSEEATKAGFPHEKAPDDKTARATWLFRESCYLLFHTGQRVLGMATSRANSAAHAAEAVVDTMRNL